MGRLSDFVDCILFYTAHFTGSRSSFFAPNDKRVGSVYLIFVHLPSLLAFTFQPTSTAWGSWVRLRGYILQSVEDKKAGGAYIPLWDVSPDERPHLAHNHFYLEGWTLD